LYGLADTEGGIAFRPDVIALAVHHAVVHRSSDSSGDRPASATRRQFRCISVCPAVIGRPHTMHSGELSHR
jgi:hypothetical protein